MTPGMQPCRGLCPQKGWDLDPNSDAMWSLDVFLLFCSECSRVHPPVCPCQPSPSVIPGATDDMACERCFLIQEVVLKRYF